MVSQRISSLPPEVFNCSHPHCTIHQDVLDSYSQHLVFTLLTCSSQCFPTISSSSSRKLAGWTDSTTNLKRTANFWHKLWNDAGCPSSGVIFQLKQNTKKKYKREVRRLTRRQKFLLQKKLARSFSKKNKNSFWADVKRMKSTSTSTAPIVDNMHDCGDIANVFASNYKTILNTHSLGSHLSLNSTLDSSLTEEEVRGAEFSGDDVLEAILQSKMGKADAEGIFSEHLIFASPALTEPLASFFTSLLRHGYMPQNLRDCVLIPIPKRNKDSSSSLNYRSISLASSLSKILERLILIKYAPYLSSSSLQFGFKAGSSTTLCTGTVKNIISNYIHNGSPVLGCFLDASKAFDLVNHGILFQKLYDRGLSQTVIRFLSSWYLTQQMSVRWGNSLSDSFKVTNGVRQGSVLSPVLFSVYLA